ncbi:hypothetical protein PQX77_006600 [Marasmius sp. AFHP31]|nr:hypothetical protein PQX77_006600 [Marasmius sp. AFHP31]
MGWKRPSAFMQYGKRFFKHRKIMQQHLSRTEMLSYNPVIVEEAQILVKNLVDIDSVDSCMLYAVRYMPSWFPGTHYGNVARSESIWIRKLHEDPVRYVQEEMTTKSFKKSFISSVLEELDDVDGPEAVEIEDIKGATAQIFSAATDTNVKNERTRGSHLSWAMVGYPTWMTATRYHTSNVYSKRFSGENSKPRSLSNITEVVV